MKKIGFIGLGIMGAPMAGHLSRKGFHVSVFNRSHKKSISWKSQYNGIVCDSIAELTASSEVIILCVGNDDDVRDIIIGNNNLGVIDNAKSGLIVIDHTTTFQGDEYSAISKRLLFYRCPSFRWSIRSRRGQPFNNGWWRFQSL
jgi:3-hydroxyisobutyrate dehydrogenase-like beta-hydroxyacid dehydrogenase